VARFDLFFSESHTATTHRNNTGTTTGAVALLAGGSDYVISAMPSLAFVEGQIVALTGSSKTAYCRVTRVQTSTNTLTLLPLQSTLDSAGVIGTSFPIGSTITSSIATPIRAATLVVDLTEAPFTSASYLIAASGNFTTDTSSATAGACLRVSALVGDPYSGTGRDTSTGLGPSQTSVTWGTSALELAPFMGSTTVTLSGGQRYEFAIEFWSATSNATATFDEAAIVAMRCDTVYSNASTTETTTASTTAVTQYTLPTLPAGQYLVTATWTLGVSNTTYDVISDLDTGISGSTTVRSRLTLRSTSDYVSCGQMFVINVPATNAFALQLSSSSASGTAKMRNATIVAVPLPRAFDYGYVVTPDNVTTAATTATDTDIVVQDGSATLAHAGRAIQVVSSDVGTTTSASPATRIRWRALTSDGTTTPLAHGMVWGTASTSRHSTFFLYRQSLSSGSKTIKLLGRSTNVASTTLTARKTSLSWLLERADLAVLPNTPTSIVVDLENGGLLLKTWSASGSAYRKHLPVATAISRVLVNGEEYARVSGVGSLASKKWYWDSAAQDIYVQLPTGTPGDATNQVVVIPQLRVSRDVEDLISDEDGVTYLPYEPRIDTVPGMTQELVSSDGRWEVSTSLGSLTLATADGLLDDPLVQHYYDGIRARVWRGWSSLSRRQGDFDVVADALIGMPDTDFETVSFKLFDRGLNIAKPVATATATVAEGNTTDSSNTTRASQPLPVIYGTVKRVLAYRVDANYGSGSYNRFQIAGATGHALSATSAVYLDETTTKAVASANVDSDSVGTYRNAGQVRIKNDAFPEVAKPQDRVFVDVVGRTSSTTSYSATALTTSGAIARDLLVTYGGLAATDLVEASFRLLDRQWRKQLTVSPYGFVPTAPSIGFYIEGDEDVWTALLRLCGDVGAYPYVTRQGRIGVGVVDMDAPNLLDNGGFEYGDTTSWVRSWTVPAAAGATMKVSSTRKYEGTYSLELSNGASPTTTGRIEQAVVLPTPGSYVISCFASSLGGETAAFRLACYLPDGSETISEPFLLSSLKWTRCTFAFDTASGSAGSARIRIYPAYGSITATTVAVDNVELLPVAFVGDDGNTLASSLEFREDTFYEVAVSYDVNTQDADNASRLVLTDGEARGLATGVTDAKYAAQSAKRLDLGLPLVKDTASAAGIGAALLAWFGRTRHVLTIDAMSLARIPNVGERVYLKNLVQLVKNEAGEVIQRRHIPELADAYPFWLITEVAYEGDNAQVVSLKLERQQDPVVDRTEMSPEAVPMGAIGLAVSSNTVTDFTEMPSMSGYYVAASINPDTATERGSTTHQHSLSHTHTIPAHQHSTGSTTLSIGTATGGDIGPGPYDYWVVGGTDYPNYTQAFFGPAFGYLSATLTHTHTLSTGSKLVGSAGGTSSAPTSTLLSKPGSNEPSHYRVRFMQRTASTTTSIDQDLVIGYESASIPAGWSRVTALDGLYLKGAIANTAVSTTVATSTSFTPSDSGSTLSVTSATGISVGKLLQVGSGGTKVRVVVTAISGTNLTVVPVWESGDSASTYAAGVAVTGTTEVVGTTYTAVAHDHGAVIPSHQHNGGGHTHGKGTLYHSATDATPITSNVSIKDPSVNYTNDSRVAGAHSHRIYPQAQADTTASSSAAGTVTGATTAVPDAYSVVWITPTGGSLTVVPTGALMFWSAGATPPAGWQVVSAATGLLLRGAATGQGASSTATGHGHTMTPAQHDFSHQHGGTSSAFSEDADVVDLRTPDYGNGSPNLSVAAAPETGTRARNGHTHVATYDVSATDPKMSGAAGAIAVPSVTGTSGHPLHKRLVLIRKV